MNKSEVSQDYFLFSCFEFERTCKAIPHKLDSVKRWPLGRLLQENLDTTDIGASDWANQMSALLDWYKEHYPKLVEVTSLNDESLVEVVEPLVYISMDIRLLGHKIFGGTLPSFKKVEVAPEPWPAIFSHVEKAFPALSRYFKQYMWWSYQEEAVVEEEEERPPTGRYAPPPPRRSAPPSRGAAPSRPDRDDRPRRDHRDGMDRKPHRDRDRNRDRDRDRGNGGRRDVSLTPQQLEEIKGAVEQLRQNSSLDEVNLVPANSFHRHLQHSQIKEEGFFSRSEGQDKERFVVVTRQNTRPDVQE